MSGSEPRMFPGLVSRTQRRDSLVRKSSMSETDEHVGASIARKNTGRSKRSYDGKVEEAEESDRQMEEADGLDN